MYQLSIDNFKLTENFSNIIKFLHNEIENCKLQSNTNTASEYSVFENGKLIGTINYII